MKLSKLDMRYIQHDSSPDPGYLWCWDFLHFFLLIDFSTVLQIRPPPPLSHVLLESLNHGPCPTTSYMRIFVSFVSWLIEFWLVRPVKPLHFVWAEIRKLNSPESVIRRSEKKTHLYILKWYHPDASLCKMSYVYVYCQPMIVNFHHMCLSIDLCDIFKE